VPSSSLGDRNLRHRLILRDVDALGEIYGLYAPVVYGVAMRIAIDKGAAEEVTRAVFLDLWRHPQRFDPDQDRLRPWLARVAHEQAVAALREATAIRRRDERAADDGDWIIDIDEAVGAVVNTEQMRAALAALAEDEQGPIRMAYFAGKTYREVAAELGIAEDIVKSRMYSGLRRMADALHPPLLRDEAGLETTLGP
jgi:RNA polymerase sigma factor (sigma-70 family)